MYTMLIADDDQISREGICRHLLRAFPELDNIWTAQHGNEAFELYERYKPDIIITDIVMPQCDGLEFLEKLHQFGYSPLTIIISAHENFDYARNAMRLGVDEYLLKPVLPNQVSETVGRLIDKLKQNKRSLKNIQELRDKHLHNLPVLRERFFHGLINQPFDEKYIFERARLADIDLTGAAYVTAVVRVSSADTIVSELTEQSPGGIKIYSIPVNNTDTALIVISESSDAKALFRHINDSLEDLLDNAKYCGNLRVKCGVGSRYDNIGGIRSSYKEALKALESVEISEENVICNYDEISLVQKPVLKLDSRIERQLLIGVKFWGYDQCLALIEEISQQLAPQSQTQINRVQTFLLQLSVSMWRELQNLSSDHEIGFEPDFTSFMKQEDYEKCIAWFKTFVFDVTRCYSHINEQRGDLLVNKTKQILAERMAESDLSIDDVTAQLYVSASYLRQIFKRQSGESFVEYLTRIRMERAMSLLKLSDMKVREISEATGFSNQRYFAVCFKKFYGKSPTEIRKENLSEQE